jgi:integrase
MTEAKSPQSKKRRGHGEGSVYKRADGRWVASTDGGYVNGKRVRLVRYARSQAAAIALLDELRKEVKRARPATPGISTVAQFLEYWMETSVSRDRALRTVESYQDVIRIHIVPAIGKIKLAKLTRVEVQRMLDEVSSKPGIGPRSVQNVRAVVRNALNTAIDWEMIDTNPARYTHIAKVPRTERAALTFAQGKILLNQVKGDPFEALYVLAVICGVRRGELLGLRWSDIDFEKREIRIRQQVVVAGRRSTITGLKTEGSRRNMPMLSIVEDALRRRRELLDLERQFAGDQWQEHDLVFPSRTGKPYPPNNLYKKYKAHLNAAGLPDRTFHSLRHTAASFMVSMNVHPKVAAKILGHTDIKTTMEIYSHAQQDDMREALELVEAELKRGDHGL